LYESGFIIHESKNLLLYRGAPSADIDKGDFPGVWLAKKKDTAAEYGKLWVFELEPNVRILKDPNLRTMVKKYFKSLPDTHMYDSEDDSEDGEEGFELLMFPDDDFVSFLKKHGFDGYEHHSDTFLFNTKKIKKSYAYENDK